MESGQTREVQEVIMFGLISGPSSLIIFPLLIYNPPPSSIPAPGREKLRGWTRMKERGG